MRKTVLIPAISSAVALTAATGCAVLGLNGGALSVCSKEQVVIGASEWKGVDDCSATATLKKIDGNLVVSVDVTDDYICKKGYEPYEKDSVELYFDLRPGKERGQSYYARGVFQMIIDLPKEDGKAKIYWYQGEGEDPSIAIPGTTAMYVKTKNGYNIIVTIPLKGIAEKHYPVGDTINFAFGVNDIDKNGIRTQMMGAGSDLNFQDPSKLATISL
jgi:hypothetical protein